MLAGSVVADPFGALRSECLGLLSEAIARLWSGIKLDGIKVSLPSKLEFGDLTTNVCFTLARELGKSPQELASALASEINSLIPSRAELLSTAEAAGGYVNFWSDLARLAELSISSARCLGDRYGHLEVGPGEKRKIIVEHTSANPIHPMHVGHGRNAVLGDALARLLRARGHDVQTRFYVNDVGRQVAILAYGYDKLGRPRPRGKPDHFFGLIYAMTNCALEIRRLKEEVNRAIRAGSDERVRRLKAELDSWAFSAHELRRREPDLFDKLFSAVEGDEDPEASISEVVRAYEAREGWAVELVRGICEECLRGFRETLDRLGISIDKWDWESEVVWSNLVAKVLASLEASGFTKVRAGALEFLANAVAERFGLKGELGLSGEFEIPPLTLVRSDGTTLYEIRDVAYTLRKFKDADLVINVIGADQKLAQLHVKLALHALGEHEKARNLIHFAYNLVKIPGAKMSARRGRFITLDGLLEEAVSRAYDEVPEHSPGLSEEERTRIAEVVGVGAVKFTLLAQDPAKEITFTWDRVLNFEENSAPYVQYTHARACSILRKAGREPEQPDFSLLGHPLERELVLAIARFPEVVADAADSLRPDAIANFTIYLADRFNSFYASLPVIRAEPRGLSDARLALVDAVRIVLKNALGLLGIGAPERM
ncbi:MAG TPA: arginine--tRNA ligase [Candidatus Bathyarchaeota archaeon]|nr:arginine--tRNA ligase [Candidatus Bathyarchaeota archaeon]